MRRVALLGLSLLAACSGPAAASTDWQPPPNVLDRFEAAGHRCEVDPAVRVVGDGVLCDMAGVEGHVSLFHDTRAEQRRRLAGCEAVGAIAGDGWTLLMPAQDDLSALARDLGGRSACA